MYRTPEGSLITTLSTPNSVLRLKAMSNARSGQIARLLRILPRRSLMEGRSFGWTAGAGGTTEGGVSSMGSIQREDNSRLLSMCQRSTVGVLNGSDMTRRCRWMCRKRDNDLDDHLRDRVAASGGRGLRLLHDRSGHTGRCAGSDPKVQFFPSVAALHRELGVRR